MRPPNTGCVAAMLPRRGHMEWSLGLPADGALWTLRDTRGGVCVRRARTLLAAHNGIRYRI